MKKAFALAATLFASATFAQVSATPHNMNNYDTVTTGDVCYYCHAAHQSAGQAPLWARDITASTATYAYYTSSSISANITATNYSGLDPYSAACMSCHDGTIAVGTTIKGTVGSKGTTFVTGAANLGGDLSNDHPVSLTWVTGKAGLGAPTGLGNFRLFSIGGNLTITCSSCHGVHRNTIPKFLREDPNSGSFCATCHSTK